MTAPKVVDDDETGPELLAREIVNVSRAAQKLNASRLTRRAVIVLIRDMHPSLALRDIELVLDSAAKLEATYVKRAPS